MMNVSSRGVRLTLALLAAAAATPAAMAQEFPSNPPPAWAKLQPPVPYKTSEEQFAALKARAKPPAKVLPDWSGLWTRDAGGPPFNFDPAGGPDRSMPGGYGKVTAQLTPEYQAKLDKRQADVRKGIEWDYLSNCLPAGYPRWLTEPFLKEFIVTPKETWWVNEQQSEVRRIYTDGRGHTPEDEAYPLWEGDSIGFWDGDTLVVHTNHVKEGFYQRGQPDYSEQASTVEQIRMISPDVIEDKVTVYDPPALAKPWSVIQHYNRVKTPNLRINMWSCEENNNVVNQSGVTNFVLPGESGYKDPEKLVSQPPPGR